MTRFDLYARASALDFAERVASFATEGEAWAAAHALPSRPFMGGWVRIIAVDEEAERRMYPCRTVVFEGNLD